MISNTVGNVLVATNVDANDDAFVARLGISLSGISMGGSMCWTVCLWTAK